MMGNKKSIEIKSILLIFLLYTVAFGLILFNKGLFFDDWVHFNQSFSTRLTFYKDLGIFLYLPAYIYSFIFKSIFFVRVTIFISFFLSSVFLYLILKRIKEIDDVSRLFIVIFFTLFPVNYARIAGCNSFYGIGYLFFFFGFWLLAIFIEKKSIIIRILSLVFLFFSFITSSFIVFYLIPIIYILYVERKAISNFKTFIKKALKYIDFILIPVIFWFLDYYLYKPAGLYTEYNKFSLQNILSLPKSTLLVFYKSFINTIDQSIKFFRPEIFFILFFSIIIIFIINKIYHQDKISAVSKKRDMIFLAIGFMFFMLGVLPYLLVGKFPDSFKSISRHQLLLPLGFSFIFYYSFLIFSKILKLNKNIRNFIYVTFAILFIYMNFFTYLGFLKDDFKQSSLIEHIKRSEIFEENTLFLFNDKTYVLDAQQRDIGIDEYSGMMKFVFGEDTRVGFNIRYGTDLEPIKNYIKYPQYNFSNFVFTSPDYEIIVDYGQYSLTDSNTLKLLVNRLVNKDNYYRDVINVLVLSYKRL